MAYDVHLAHRVRELLVNESRVTEKKMFGGLAFLVASKVAVVVSGQGGLLVRADRARAEHLLATTNAQPMQMKGRALQGWLHVDGDDLHTKRRLAKWTAIGIAAATSAPRSGTTTPHRANSRPRPIGHLVDGDGPD